MSISYTLTVFCSKYKKLASTYKGSHGNEKEDCKDPSDHVIDHVLLRTRRISIRYEVFSHMREDSVQLEATVRMSM